MRIKWQIATVEVAGSSTRSSLAFSPSGRPAIAYHSSFNNALRFATLNDDGTWAISTVDTAFIDCKPSLAFKFSHPAISYRVGDSDLTGELRYAQFRGGTPAWSIMPVAPSANASSLAFDSGQRAGISYYAPDSKTLRFATQDSPSIWITQAVDTDQDVGDFNSLAFTPLSGVPFGKSADRPAIAYHAHANPFDLIKYAVFDGSAWHRQTVWQGIGSCSLVFDLAGNPTISFSQGGFIAVFVPDGGSWTAVGGWSGGDTSAVAYDPSPTWRWGVSYTASHVRYAHGQGWGLRPNFLVDQAGKDQTGHLIGPFEWTSLAFSPSGHPAISYYDSSNYTIKYAVGTIFPSPLDDVISFLSGLLFRMTRATRRVPKPRPGATFQ